MSKCVNCGRKTEAGGLLCTACAKQLAFSARVTGTAENIRSYNVGESDYAKHKIQPWDIWIEYKLNPFDADIVKRVLRHKKTDSRKMDYEKIIHICKERIRQLEIGNDPWEE